MEIVHEDKEIIITKTYGLLLDFIPHSPEAFEILCDELSDYEIVELDENFLRFQFDRKQIMCPN